MMKPFDLRAAKAGAAVVTMHGHRAKILCFDKKGELPVVAIVDFEDHEVVYDYFEDGTTPHFAPLRLALMMRDDYYAEKMERGEYGNHIEDKPEKVDREHLRRELSKKIMVAMIRELAGKSPHSTNNNITVYEAMAADAVSYADALLEELDKKK